MSFERYPNSAPLTPGLYGAQLLVRELVAGGLSEVRGDVLPFVPDLLKPELDGFQVAGRLAEIGAPYAEMSNPDLSTDRLREARAHSAHVVAYVRSATQSAVHLERQQDASEFLNNVRHTLVAGRPSSSEQPTETREAVLEYGDTLHRHLGLNADPALANGLNDLLFLFNDKIIKQLNESKPDRRDPKRLLDLAVFAGGYCAEMAAVMAAKPDNLLQFARFRTAANAFGGIGFAQEQATNIINGRLESYTSALIRQEGDLSAVAINRALQRAHAMRRRVATDNVREGMAALRPGRERDMYGSQLWFAQNVYPLQRLAGRPGRNERIRQALRTADAASA